MEQTQDKGAGGGLNPFGSDDEEDPGRGGEEQRATGTGEALPSQQDTPLKIESHCTALGGIMSDPAQLTDPFLLEEFRGHLTSVEKLVSRERPQSRGEVGDNLAVILSQNIIEKVYVFSTLQKATGRAIRVMLLRFFTEVFAHSVQDVLIHQQFLRPLNRLLRACEGTREGDMASALVPLLHQICILIQMNQSLLDLFFIEAKAHHPARFILLSQLIPYMHDVTEIGNRARDALLLCLSLADQLSHASLSQFIAIESNFCQVLATGLSGLYSDLPTSVSYSVDEWQSPLPVIESCVPGLAQFYLALDFCNSVLQISSKVICDGILTLVRDGFLQQVIGPALFQKSEEAATVTMVYLALFLGHITNMALMREFLKFLVVGKYDDRSIVNIILNSINSTNINTCTVALELVYVLIDLNCEDVLLELVFKSA
ncbi:UPF0518 protein CG3558 [Geodia barretti]|uniref:UPF0518 protein CG3558 n=1 Tax=Geodia barretti TaxID=519541 RepID=A0AA35THY9_GEOBA|nr:UPF0518 protein CG3558 [Geodia barretti]